MHAGCSEHTRCAAHQHIQVELGLYAVFLVS